MKSFPEGQYLESPEPKIWDNLVAISAHEGVTPMQALTTLDDQNAKKLGLTNTNLLEKKVRAWLATADGKTYADANKTPKPALLSHIKKVDAGHTDFTNKTGIDLPPGEKVQKLGGPGEFEEHAPDSKFGKYDVATAEADQIKFKKEQGIKFTPQQKAALTEYVNGSGAINGWLRDEHTPSQQSIDNAIYLQSMMMPTQRDHYLLRGTGWTQFPPEARSYEGLQKLVGETLEEPAFLSASVSKSSSGFGGAVKMHIQAPKGTMGVFTKDDQYKSQFLGSEAELLLAAKTELKVLKVWKEGGQVQVLMRVVS
jgi:ADP-ribosyltransferase exoenzyme